MGGKDGGLGMGWSRGGVAGRVSVTRSVKMAKRRVVKATRRE